MQGSEWLSFLEESVGPMARLVGEVRLRGWSCDGKTHAERHPGSQAGWRAGRVRVAVGCRGFLCAVVGKGWAVVSEVRAQECHGDLYMGVTGTHAGGGSCWCQATCVTLYCLDPLMDKSESLSATFYLACLFGLVIHSFPVFRYFASVCSCHFLIT